MEIRRDVFQAIADPNRRAIIQLIARQPLTFNGVAEHFSVSRPAIAKHIRILEACGLLVVTQKGRERYCEPRLEKLQEVSAWVEAYRGFWHQKLDQLEPFLAEPESSEPSK